MGAYAANLIWRYDGLWIATFPDVPEVTAFGRDDEEALEEAAKSLHSALVRRELRGDALPPAKTTGKLLVEPSSGLALALS